jgi:hypothetical protein
MIMTRVNIIMIKIREKNDGNDDDDDGEDYNRPTLYF